MELFELCCILFSEKWEILTNSDGELMVHYHKPK